MIISRTDSTTNDWSFGKGLSNYARDEEAVEQNIRSRVLSWAYDCFFAQTDGIDYSSLLDKGQQNNLLLAIRQTILSSFGVLNVTSLSATLDSVTRKINIVYSANTIFGQAINIKINQ